MTDRKPLMAGNWKMHHNHLEAIQVVQKLSYRLDDKDYDARRRRRCARRSPRCARCRRRSTATASRSRSARRTATGRPRARSPARSARRCSPSCNVQYVIVGHSERRELFGETDEMVAKKLRAVLARRHAADPVRRRDARRARGGRDRGEGRRPGPGRARRVCRPTTADAAWSPTSRSGRSAPAATPRPRTPTPRSASIRGDARARSPARTADRDADPVRRQREARQHRRARWRCPTIDGGLVGGAILDPDEFARIVRYSPLNRS